MYIELLGRPDRLGANITNFIAQICYAVFHNVFIVYNKYYIEDGDDVFFRLYNKKYNQNYNNSIFVQTLFDYIDIHNENLKNKGYPYGEKIHMFSIDYFLIMSKVLLDIKLDYFSFFKQHIYPKVYNIFLKRAIEKNYLNIMPFNPKKTIMVHLRLDDVRASLDYDGYHCADHFRKNINNDMIADYETHTHIKSIYPHCNAQSPLSSHKINNQISIALQKYPDYEIIILTNPGENPIEFPYRVISNDDESMDLFFLSQCDVIILSRSSFALTSLYFTQANNKDIYVPLWGHLPCFGLFTKYDNSNFNYFS